MMVHYYKYYVLGHNPSSCLYLKTPSYLFFKKQRFGERSQSPKRCVLKYKQDDAFR
jgi:hypothetical protein